MNERKVIQLSQCRTDDEYTLLALCNDGTMWAAPDLPWTTAAWEQIAPVPQPTPTEARDDER